MPSPLWAVKEKNKETMIIAINANAMLKTTRYPEYAYMYM